jgi:hypothetical protein
VDVLSIESIELGKSFLSTSPSDPLHGSVSNQSHVSPFSLMSVIADGVDEVRKAAREELRKRAAQIQGSPRFDGTARFNCSPAKDRNRRDLPVQPGPGEGRLTTRCGPSAVRGWPAGAARFAIAGAWSSRRPFTGRHYEGERRAVQPDTGHYDQDGGPTGGEGDEARAAVCNSGVIVPRKPEKIRDGGVQGLTA